MAKGYLKVIAGDLPEVDRGFTVADTTGVVIGAVKAGGEDPRVDYTRYLGLVSEIASATSYRVMYSGTIIRTAAQWAALNASGLNIGPGLPYYASASQPGKLTSNNEDSLGLMGYAISSTEFRVQAHGGDTPKTPPLNKITKASHGLVVGNPVDINGDKADITNMIGFVAKIIGDDLYVQESGVMELTNAEWRANRWAGNTFIAGVTYYLTGKDLAENASRLNANSNHSAGIPVLKALSSTHAYIYPRANVSRNLLLTDTDSGFEDKLAKLVKTKDAVGPTYRNTNHV